MFDTLINRYINGLFPNVDKNASRYTLNKKLFPTKSFMTFSYYLL